MDLGLHHTNDHRKPPELLVLRRSQRILFEERKDTARQVLESSHIKSIEVLAMIVMTSVDEDVTASEEPLQILKNAYALRTLHYRKCRLDLPAYPVAGVPKDGNTEAALTVDEADDPLLDAWPFLLIARTGRVFTAHAFDATSRR
jgi:hypothetical protein